MSIRNGAFSNKRNLFSDEFYEMVDGLEKRLDYAKKNTDLPKEPDYSRIEDFLVSVKSEIIKERG